MLLTLIIKRDYPYTQWTQNFPGSTSADKLSPQLGSRLFVLACEAEMMSKDYAWLITDGLSNSLDAMDPRAIDLMEGVLWACPQGVRQKSPSDHKCTLTVFSGVLSTSLASDQVNIFDILAYDTVFVLAMAIEKIGPDEY
ncbi:hypothetical protein Patl1_14367 [Pistacia atlantica]|uniref:Uncharacterized protein n=1 Tax=Pistacia atlantica TaxID=434234 RepID=A0ACC1AWD0_9ROSI|nr:hypothetical protein Patl1_14367 [Pistacia atlantica]